ncbi:MAG: class I SAM-dependent DNA methyltransferase [Acidobacteriota bacterium]
MNFVASVLPVRSPGLEERSTLEEISEARQRARKLAAGLSSEDALGFARAFSAGVLRHYWSAATFGTERPLREPRLALRVLSPEEEEPASRLASAFARLADEDASYGVGTLYTSLLPEAYRSSYGAYYTPPALVRRLLENVSALGFDWARGTILDPACGGAAFLAPIATAIIRRLRADGRPDAVILDHLARRLRGVEIDPFAAWLSMALVDLAVVRGGVRSDWTLPDLVTVGDALRCCGRGRDLFGMGRGHRFDLVIGNPPYGRVSLPARLRTKYARSLYGHANLYGLFTDLALRLTGRSSIVAYVTPTSFLGGQYFKRLRSLLGEEARPASLDFVESRTGVFEDVLQETVLAVFERRPGKAKTRVSAVTPSQLGSVEVEELGEFDLPRRPEDPWVFPRSRRQHGLLENGTGLKARLSDYGFAVSTGPLVWNRHKDQLTSDPGENHLPLVWAEAVSSRGEFSFSASGRNHQPYFRLKKGQDHLVTNAPCLLVQRTTAKEQSRRLIAAILPEDFLRENPGGVVVENHLNIVRSVGRTRVPLEALWVLFNSETLDGLFRCINGSVAVSAYELNALPLPTIKQALELAEMARTGCSRADLEERIRTLYGIRST